MICMSNKYTERFQVGLTFEQMSFLINKAWDLNISMSKYIRSLIDREMEKEDFYHDSTDL